MLRKKLKTSIVISISLLLTAISFFSLIPLFNHSENDNVAAFGEYLIENVNKLADNYSKYSKFRLGSNSSGTVDAQKGFNELVKFLRQSKVVDLSGNVYDNDYFSGKTIILEGNVQMDSTYMPTFNGTFDGNGHTIKFTQSLALEAGEHYYGRLFDTLNGTIKNLRVTDSNITLMGKALNGKVSRASAFIGTCNGTIDSCIIKDCTFTSERTGELAKVAPITARIGAGGKVSNCLVDGNYTLIAKGLHNIYGFLFNCINGEPSNSIFNAFVKTDGGGVYEPGEDTDEGKLDNINLFNCCSNAYDYMKSNISATTGSSGTTWFKYKDKYSGFSGVIPGLGGYHLYCVYLRSFISWKTYNFTTDGNGTVDFSYVIVPTDYDDVTVSDFPVISVYDKSVTATPNTGYYFNKWTNSGNTYTATFIAQVYYLEFQPIGTDTTTIVPGCSTFESGTTKIKISYGASVNVMYSFEGSGSSSGLLIAYFIGSHRITYWVTDSKYDLDNYGSITAGSVTFGIEGLKTNYHHLTMNGIYSVVPELKLKSYNVGFG